MTACVNNENGIKGGVSHKVLRSVVAGVLAVSMVPTTALAVESEGASVDLLATDANAFLKNKVTYNVEATDGQYVFQYTGDPVDFSVDKVTDVHGNVEFEEGTDYNYSFFTRSGTAGSYTYTQTTTANGASDTGKAPSKVGTYYIGVYDADTSGAWGESNTIFQEFFIRDASLADATIYQKGTDAGDLSDTTFTYTGSDLKSSIGVAVDGQAVDVVSSGTNPDKNEVTVEITSAPVDNGGNSTMTSAGEYTLKITGVNGAVKGQVLNTKVSVDKFDLSKATVTIKDADTTQGATNVAAAEIAMGEDVLSTSVFSTSMKTENVAFKSADPNVTGVPVGYADKGTYTVEFAAVDDNPNVIGSAKGTMNVVAKVMGVFAYDMVDFAKYDQKNPLSIQSDLEQAFNVGNIKVADSSDATQDSSFGTNKLYTAINNPLAKKDYTVTVTKDGKEVSDYTQPGLYKVVVSVNTGTDYAKGGTGVMYFKVSKATLTASDVFVAVEGSNIAGDESNGAAVATFDGEAKRIDVTVLDGDGKEISADDYEVTIKDSKGNEVDEVVNADTYTLVVTSDVYKIASNDGTFKFKVGAANITGVRVAGLVTIKNDSSTKIGLPYTGAPVVPAFEYTTDALVNGKVPADAEWKTLPAEAYALKLSDGTTGKLTKGEAINTGDYTVALTNNTKVENATVSKNYNIASYTSGLVNPDGTILSSKTFNIIDAKVFEDVPVTEWYAESVAKAADLDYMNGYYGTKLFGPNDKITRAEAVCVLFNMAGGTIADNDPESDLADYAAKFSDVSKDAWYAQALGWAAKTKVVSGYADGTFGPDDKLTREQFAAMLANYAKAAGNYTAADASSIEDYSDAAEVSDWAAESVAWAVANEVMGNGSQLWPTATISRAEVATMAVNYQPEKLK